MNYICCKIDGLPYCQSKSRGSIGMPKKWTDDIVNQTKGLPRIKDACILRVTFLLPKNKYPSDLKYGSDLDNLLKRFLDALSQTVFSESKGKDSCIISLSATKTKVESEAEAGALLEIVPVIVE